MAVMIHPSDVERAEIVMVTSDAPDNDSAIREIDRWATEHGFVRSREYRLNPRRSPEGVISRYSACYRLSEGDRRAADADMALIRRNRERMPLTTSSDILLRED